MWKFGPKMLLRPHPPSSARVSEAIGAPYFWSLLYDQPDFRVSFFQWRTFAKFRPEKYDFDLYKGFFMENHVALGRLPERNPLYSWLSTSTYDKNLVIWKNKIFKLWRILSHI
jgi:hypothetical protein